MLHSAIFLVDIIVTLKEEAVDDDANGNCRAYSEEQADYKARVVTDFASDLSIFDLYAYAIFSARVETKIIICYTIRGDISIVA